VSVVIGQRIVLLVLTNSLQWLHSTNLTHVSSRRSSELEKILTPRRIDDTIDRTLARLEVRGDQDIGNRRRT
jgi:hypothetical protein